MITDHAAAAGNFRVVGGNEAAFAISAQIFGVVEGEGSAIPKTAGPAAAVF